MIVSAIIQLLIFKRNIFFDFWHCLRIIDCCRVQDHRPHSWSLNRVMAHNLDVDLDLINTLGSSPIWLESIQTRKIWGVTSFFFFTFKTDFVINVTLSANVKWSHYTRKPVSSCRFKPKCDNHQTFFYFEGFPNLLKKTTKIDCRCPDLSLTAKNAWRHRQQEPWCWVFSWLWTNLKDSDLPVQWLDSVWANPSHSRVAYKNWINWITSFS